MIYCYFYYSKINTAIFSKEYLYLLQLYLYLCPAEMFFNMLMNVTYSNILLFIVQNSLQLCLPNVAMQT